MKKTILFSVLVFFFSTNLYCFVDTITNESGIDITILITDEDGSKETPHTLAAGEKKVFNRESKCVYGIKEYGGRWKTVDDLEPDDTLVIPEGWNRCQNWDFTIKKRIDGTVYVARKQGIPTSSAS